MFCEGQKHQEVCDFVKQRNFHPQATKLWKFNDIFSIACYFSIPIDSFLVKVLTDSILPYKVTLYIQNKLKQNWISFLFHRTTEKIKFCVRWKFNQNHGWQKKTRKAELKAVNSSISSRKTIFVKYNSKALCHAHYAMLTFSTKIGNKFILCIAFMSLFKLSFRRNCLKCLSLSVCQQIWRF